MDMQSAWPVRQVEFVERERVLPIGRGAVLAAMDDQVEPEQVIVQSTSQPPVLAGMRGHVRRVVPERGVVIGGPASVVVATFGMGHPAVGTLLVLPPGVTVPPGLPPGAVLVSTVEMTLDLWQRALAAQAVAVIAASARPAVVAQIAGTDATALADGSHAPAQPVPMALLLAHGFGARALKPELAQILSAHHGQIVLVDPVMDPVFLHRPECVIPLPWQTPIPPDREGGVIPGALVWVRGGPANGLTGRVAGILQHAQPQPNGIRALAAQVNLENGTRVTVPLANVQRIG